MSYSLFFMLLSLMARGDIGKVRGAKEAGALFLILATIFMLLGH